MNNTQEVIINTSNKINNKAKSKVLIIIMVTHFLFPIANASTSFVALGHLYPLFQTNGNIDEKKRTLMLLFNKVNNLKPNYVVILGDSHLEEEKVKELLINGFKSNVLFVPGNVDLAKGKDKYINNIGYLEKIVETESVKLVLFNSSESAQYLNSYFQDALHDDVKENDKKMIRKS